jgi:hypothetical protein
MDTEEGVEVVWNEVIYSQSSRKSTKASKERLKAILQGLTSVKVSHTQHLHPPLTSCHMTAPEHSELL